jgi:rod shape-determining protein MreC
MLITDPRSRLAVEIARTRAQGILKGEGEDGCVVRIPKDFDVQEGDLVQTSGVDELFPRGHPVGQVSRVEDLVGDERLVHVIPSVRFDRLDVVWVVLARAPQPDPLADKVDRPIQARGLHPVQ